MQEGHPTRCLALMGESRVKCWQTVMSNHTLRHCTENANVDGEEVHVHFVNMAPY
jgi:hypothetical protein